MSRVEPAALLHTGPAVGFEQPMHMLQACHERVQRSLDLLQRLGEHLDAHGVDPSAVAAAQDVMRYFDIAGPLHHEDEERHVLPRLRAAGHNALAERLHADHRALALAWSRWRPVLAQVCEGNWNRTVSAHVRSGWRDFEARYAAHIALEEGQAFALAANGMADATRDDMGREMAARRGVVRMPARPAEQDGPA
jgi:hemerythrin-like domain-containing protein